MASGRELMLASSEAEGGALLDGGGSEIAEGAPAPGATFWRRRLAVAVVLAFGGAAAALAVFRSEVQPSQGPLEWEDAIESYDTSACPANTVKAQCLENGAPDMDCCAMTGTASCIDGSPAAQGTRCASNGAVSTCCPPPALECPAEMFKIGCKMNGHFNSNCCAPPEQAGCYDAVSNSIGVATEGSTCSPDGLKFTCCPRPKPALKSASSLFCWMVSSSSGGEAALTRAHYNERRSIFECDAWYVLSDGPLPPIPFIYIGALNSGKGWWNSWTNEEVFVRAWDAVLNTGTWLQHAWTVKVDPDTVWFPQRLMWHVNSLRVNYAQPVFIRNTGMYMCGGIEVVSLKSMIKYYKGRKQYCAWSRSGNPEDTMLGKCLNALGCWEKWDDKLLRNYMNGVDGCNDHYIVAFHPFKWVDGWRTCYNRASR